MLQCLALFLCSALAVKFDIQLFYGSPECDSPVRPMGYAMFDESATSFRLRDGFSIDSGWIVNVTGEYSTWYTLSWTDQLNQPEKSQWTHNRFDVCSFGPRNHVVMLRKLDGPVFETLGCESDADCDDGVDCTETSCDLSIRRCNVTQLSCQNEVHKRSLCVPKSCFGGPMARQPCAVDSDCYGGVCASSVCRGGLQDGRPCDQVRTWSHFRCTEDGGICVPGESKTGCFYNPE